MLQELEFEWTGQIARFRVEGTFSYELGAVGPDGIVDTSELSDLDVSFFDPDGNLLITYEDNHLDEGVNFNFDVEAQEILQDGVFAEPDGINLGDGARSDGLTFWSKPFAEALPHLHVDDWQGEFGFPNGFGRHQDVGFFKRTTQDLVDTGRVGEPYLGEIEADPERLEEFGERIALAASDGPIEPFVPSFASAGGGLVELEGSGQLVFAGGGDDLVDAAASTGGNRVYFGGGDDVAILGQGDRFFGGSGDDRFFAVEGGHNVLTGGPGADQFWITTGDFIVNRFEIDASEGYYTFAGNVSGNSDFRLLSDKATAIGFAGLDTNSFLRFEDFPVERIGESLLSATLQLEHDVALTELANLIPATAERPVEVSIYALEDGAEFDPVGGNDADIDFGADGSNAFATTSVGANGVYAWDLTALVEGEPDNEGLNVALSGVFGNSDTDGRNAYAAFYPVDADDGLAPRLMIEAEGVNVVTDFTSGLDVIGIAGFDLEFDDIDLTQDGNDARVGILGTDFAILHNVDVASLGADDFFIA